jgi:hypothetical protein
MYNIQHEPTLLEHTGTGQACLAYSSNSPHIPHRESSLEGRGIFWRWGFRKNNFQRSLGRSASQKETGLILQGEFELSRRRLSSSDRMDRRTSLCGRSTPGPVRGRALLKYPPSPLSSRSMGVTGPGLLSGNSLGDFGLWAMDSARLKFLRETL